MVAGGAVCMSHVWGELTCRPSVWDGNGPAHDVSHLSLCCFCRHLGGSLRSPIQPST